ncbi:MAG: hypothetical protein U0271_26585 [Polyangiaceae bacterium]
MKTKAIGALTAALLVGCGAGPSEPVTLGTSSAGATVTPERTWLELRIPSGGLRKNTVLVAHGPNGQVRYSVNVGDVNSVLASPDGGAWVLSDKKLTRYDDRGHEVSHTDIEETARRLVSVGDQILLYDFVKHLLTTVDPKSGTLLGRTPLDAGITDVAARGEVLVHAHLDGVSRRGPNGAELWRRALRAYASGRGFEGDVWRNVAVGADGTILVGGRDGSLLGFDPAGNPIFQLGVRGMVDAIEPLADGAFLVFTETAGRVTVVQPNGAVVADDVLLSSLPALAPPLDVADRRFVGDNPVRQPSAPTGTYRAETVFVDGRPLQAVRALVASGDELWALGMNADTKPATEPEIHLFHYDGKGWSDAGSASVELPKAVYAEGHEAAPSRVDPQSLAIGPDGGVLVLGVRASYVGDRPVVLERRKLGGARSAGGEPRLGERADLRAALSKLNIDRAGVVPTYAVTTSGVETLCAGDELGCVQLPRGGAAAPLEGSLRELEGGRATALGGAYWGVLPLVAWGDETWRANGSIGADGALWAVDDQTVIRQQGGALQSIEGPSDKLFSIWAQAETDVWLGGPSGLMHYDGKRFARVVGVQGTHDPDHGELRLAHTSAGVWAGNGYGLWRVTPDPAGADIVGAAAPVVNAAPPSAVLDSPTQDSGFTLARYEIAVPHGDPMRGALSVSATRDGLLWFYDGVRVVEVDTDGAVRVLYQAPPPRPFVCWSTPEPDCEVCATCTTREPLLVECDRCAAASRRGEGAFIGPKGLVWIRDGAPVAAGPFALGQLSSVTPDEAGQVWGVVESAMYNDVSLVATTAKSTRVVLGAPDATYMDVSAGSGDDVWLAGGLRSLTMESGDVSPEGEGTLVRFDGRAFTRYRAPDGVLWSVAPAEQGEAWAVGLRGGIVHVKGDKALSHRLSSETALRAVSVAGRDDVWIAGDGGTLLHSSDGATFKRVSGAALSARAPLTGIVPPRAGRPGYVVAASGIWKILPNP